MLVEVWEDSCGNVLVRPVSEKIRKQVRRHNKEWAGHVEDTVLFQADDAASAFLADLTRRQRREMEGGYTVRIRVDPWVFGHWVGYDFHEVIRP